MPPQRYGYGDFENWMRPGRVVGGTYDDLHQPAMLGSGGGNSGGYAGGAGGGAIRLVVNNTLSLNGVVSARDSKKRSRTTVGWIVNSKTYVGVWYYGKNGNLNGHAIVDPEDHWLAVEIPAIIDMDLWEAA